MTSKIRPGNTDSDTDKDLAAKFHRNRYTFVKFCVLTLAVPASIYTMDVYQSIPMTPVPRAHRYNSWERRQRRMKYRSLPCPNPFEVC